MWRAHLHLFFVYLLVAIFSRSAKLECLLVWHTRYILQLKSSAIAQLLLGIYEKLFLFTNIDFQILLLETLFNYLLQLALKNTSYE